MKMTILLPLLAAAQVAAAQGVARIEQGATLRLARGTQVSFCGVDVAVEGELRCDTSTVVGVGGSGAAARLSSWAPLAVHTLAVRGDAALDAGELACRGDVLLGSGVLDLAYATLRLGGSLLGESEEGYLTGGRAEKVLPAAAAGARVSTGMGLGFTAAQGYDALLVVRSHERQPLRGGQPLAKRYAFPAAVELSGVEFSYLLAQAPPASGGGAYQLYGQAPSGAWAALPAEDTPAAKRVVGRGAAPVEVAALTLLPLPALGFPKLLTPNGDGVNDCFEVLGLEQHPNARLVVLLPSGRVVHDEAPYGNGYRGEGLPTGTCYYLFYADKADARPVKKGFFELVRE
jgi:gliding motility-associated-like protein